MVRGLNNIPFIPDNIEPAYVYYNFMFGSIFYFITAAYFTKVIFF